MIIGDDKEYAYKQFRSSMIGKSEEEIYKYFTTQTEMAEDSLPIMSAKAGTALHRLVQAQQYELGNIATAEKFIHNERYNFTGHIDAVSNTLGIGDIKTVSRGQFQAIKKKGPKKSHISQVNSYMATTGTHEGYIQYVMREDPTQQIVYKLEYDEATFQEDMAKVARVQGKVQADLDAGRLKYDQLRQTDSVKVLAAEGAKAHDILVEDTSKVERLVDYFLHYQHKLDEKTGELAKQKIAYAKYKSNQALNSFGKREDQNTIEGFGHGWFGSKRSQNTDFGSPYQIGKYHSIAGMTNTEIQEMFGNQMGLDIETTNLTPTRNSVFQVAMAYDDSNFQSKFVKQPTNNLTEFLEKTGVGQVLKRKAGIDFTKKGKLQDYSNFIFGEEERKLKRIASEVTNRQRVKEALTSFFDVAKTTGKSVLVANANFEIRHLENVMGEKNTINYSPEYLSLRKAQRAADRLDQAKLKLGEITEEEYFQNKVNRQKATFTQVMDDAKAGGRIVEVQEIAKTMNAVAQQKGFIPRTGNFATGTNIENLASLFLGKAELHEGVSDIAIQNRLVSNKMIPLIRDMEAGTATADNPFFRKWNDSYQSIYRNSMRKMIESELETKGHLLDIDPSRRMQFSFSPVDNKSLFDQAKRQVGPKYQAMLNGPIDPIVSTQKNVRLLRNGAIIGASLLAFAALKNAFRFSGRDDESNTIEGLRHGGLAEQHRKLYTDFGSGFQRDNYHEGTQDPTDTNYMPLVYTAAAAGLIRANWNQPFGNTKIDDLGYFGRLAPDRLNSEVLNRTQATYGDVVVSGLKRFEASLGGLPKSLGLSELVSAPSFASADFTVDLTQARSQSFAKYMDGLLKRDLFQEGVNSVTFKDGAITLNKAAGSELVPGKFTLMRLSHDLNQQESMAQLAKAMTRIHGVNYIDPKQFPFVPVGGDGLLDSSAAKRVHAYVHESISKYIRLMDDPLEAIRELTPDIEYAPNKKLKKFMRKMPKFGVGNEQGLVGSTTGMLAKHGQRLGIAAGLIYFGFGTADWLTRQLAPDDTVLGDAGLIGAGAETVRTAHQTYARFSDITGLTSLRDAIESQAPGMDGWKAVAGLTLSGALAGASYGIAEGLVKEVSASGKRYEQFIENKKAVEQMPEFMRRLPGMSGEYTRTGRLARMGGAIGMLASLPFFIAGFGADQSYNELEEIYEGRQEVAVRKGRFWEASMTPWEGDKIEYFRPGWYARLRDDSKTAELYGGDDISPVGKFMRSLMDPYWLEKRRYEDQPYPFTGPDGSALGIFGPLYEATLGRALKAPAYMHREEMEAALQREENISAELGGLGGEVRAPDSGSSLLRKQWNAALEAMGLRGFIAGSLKEGITGEQGFGQYGTELANASQMDSAVRDFYDLQLGGGILTTEAVRRVMQREERGAVTRINPLRNNMPSWMPGQGFYINFKEGDPFAKVKDGYYRLPGEGFATRYEELKGLNPEDYPDIFKFKILADVGYGSREFKDVKEKLENRTLTPDELQIYNQTLQQIDEKEESKEQFRDPGMYETILGRYSAFVTDVARMNPVEQLTPLSPARKFLPAADPVDRYEELVYGKDFRRWSHPFEDFIMPAIRQSLNLVGVDATPEDIEYARQLEDYFDKLKFAKLQRLAEESRAEGNTGAANLYEKRAGLTLSSIDPYADKADLMKVLPKRDKAFFDKFMNASLEQRERILELSSPMMRDIYIAQWDKQAIETIQSGELEMDRDKAQNVLVEMKNRAAQIRGRRQAQLQEFMESGNMPAENWAGWDRRVDLEDVKMKHLINEGRDYHYYGLWQDRLNQLARKPYVNQAAENLAFKPMEHRDRYHEAYNRARAMGIDNPKIAMMPGIEQGADLDIQMRRDEERRRVLQDLGYVI